MHGWRSVGTIPWMAPEVVKQEDFLLASDIWSVGCTVHELITGAPPFFDFQPMQVSVLHLHTLPHTFLSLQSLTLTLSYTL